MTFDYRGTRSVRGLARCLAALLAFATLAIGPASAADEPDLIFRRSTVFKWLSPNDKLATYGIDDPEVEGVACHFTVPERGGFKGWLGLAEEVSDISLACRQIGPIWRQASEMSDTSSARPSQPLNPPRSGTVKWQATPSTSGSSTP